MQQLTEAELTSKINKFLSKKFPGYMPEPVRPHEERELDKRKPSFLTRLSQQSTLLVGSQPILHR